MLENFVEANRADIISRCRARVSKRLAPPPTPAEIYYGVPIFLDQLTVELRGGLAPDEGVSETSTPPGQDVLIHGFTPAQVVHDYADVCQAITELAVESRAPISSDDFRVLHRCLDDAIAAAITQYTHQMNLSSRNTPVRESDRIRVLGDGLRTTLEAARAAFQAIVERRVGLAGSTGMVLERNLQAAEDLNERLQSELAKSPVAERRAPERAAAERPAAERPGVERAARAQMQQARRDCASDVYRPAASRPSRAPD